MGTLERLQARLAEFERSDWESVGIEIRTQFAGIINKAFQEKGWSQRQLAHAAGMHESRVSKLLHGDDNCELNTIARILFALGVRVSVMEASSVVHDRTSEPEEAVLLLEDNTDGKEQDSWIEPVHEEGPQVRFTHTASYPASDEPEFLQPNWVDSMRVMFRADASVVVLAFNVTYAEVPMSVEVARLYTSVAHLKRMIDVLSKNVAIYEEGMKDKAKAVAEGSVKVLA